MEGTTVLPNARQDKLLVQAVGDELVVYDQERHRVHRLNRSAALVWQHCDGQTSISDMVALLNSETNLPGDEKVVWLALDRLERARLLREGVMQPTDTGMMTRREFLRLGTKLGAATGVALLYPVVESIVAPTPALAKSLGGGCTCDCLCFDEETPITFPSASATDCEEDCERICKPAGGTGRCRNK